MGVGGKRRGDRTDASAAIRIGGQEGRLGRHLIQKFENGQRLPSVVYRSGQLLDLARIAAGARERDILVGFDCSHSVGAIPHRLGAWGADFAFWCSYKYLNGGPGAVGGLYLNRRHAGQAPGLAGWFGSRKDRQFDMRPDLRASSEGAGGFQIGTLTDPEYGAV